MSIFKRAMLIILVIMVCFITSCTNKNRDYQRDHIESKEVTTIEIKKDEIVKFSEEPLKILYAGQMQNWGVQHSNADGMILNFLVLSQLCEKELGYPLEFIQLNEDKEIYNQYATYINSGSPADLIFPVKVNVGGEKRCQYWGDQYVNEGLYMDISPNLAQFCPEAILNFERYPEIKEMCMRDGKIYALYAGMPKISALSIFIRNELVEENNITGFHDFDMLFKLMQDMYYRNEELTDNKKIMVHPYYLLRYIIHQSGYYPLYNEHDILLKQEDENCILYPIEDTDVLDNFFEMFRGFFENTYIISETNTRLRLLNVQNGQDMYITDDPLRVTKAMSRNFGGDEENFFNFYTMFLLNDQKPVITAPDSIQRIIVPYTCTQPEKALYFMQWMMTDEDVSDILTFGSVMKELRHYRYSEDGTTIPWKYNTIYAFCNLIANFTDKVFLYGNKSFDVSKAYKEMTYKAVYPPLYKKIDSQHINYELLWELEIEYFRVKSIKYIKDSLQELITNPYGSLSADIMKAELTEIARNDGWLEYCTELVHKRIMYVE